MVRQIRMLFVMLAVVIAAGAVALPVQAEGLDALTEALKGGKVSGSFGNYAEYMDKSGANNYGWSTTYVELKYKTAEWNRLAVGLGFFAHGDSYNHSKAAGVDPFNVDVEKEVAMHEAYLTSGLLEKSSFTIGRFDHRKISHIDDNQTEGAYFAFNEIKDASVNVGVMRRFAEIDYDDGEDFGRNTKAQDLGSKATYGPNSRNYMVFVDGKVKAMDVLTFNPYVMDQQGYASVMGLDTDLKLKAGDLTYGSNFYYYYVDSKQATSSDASVYGVAPYIKFGAVDASVGFVDFDEGTALNKPVWLGDNFLPMDQNVGYPQDNLTYRGAEVYFAKVKYTLGKAWAHVAMAQYSYGNATMASGDGIKEYEAQAGYNLTKDLSLNVRLFDVNYDHVSNLDYQKIETHVSYKF